MKKYIKNIICSIALLGCFSISFAQFPGGPGVPDEDPIDNPAAPIDDYIPFVLILGAGIGAYSLSLKKKKATDF
ncbi:hypothetical protein LX95_02227 [Mesonia algae]|uniref:Secreted protein with PEP-CTERM sorting signal n=1 Tax=Mesonia algae TaxID=213248 RepID=A0A2W7IID4_9FLAO|nr:hypothetical protein [Mesonia algae]PZW39087.1 hypothetical protein LX95_02227 [Mesonia algae]